MPAKSLTKELAERTGPARFVLDGSVTLARLFQDEKDRYADAILAGSNIIYLPEFIPYCIQV
jgi:hypothetical protein